ncbi:MAG: sugar phosphate isomerase/epimerase family protein [Cyclobacteriaceae bacterium]
MNQPRRTFIKRMASSTAGAGMITVFPSIITACSGKSEQSEEIAVADSAETAVDMPKELFFKISLAEWSLHKTLFDGKLTNMEFPAKAKNDFGIDALEYVNQFFKDKAQDQAYLGELKQRTDDLGMTNVLIMIDGEGGLGGTDDAERMKAVENHYKWVEAAKFLGCHSIRVNAYGEGSAEDVMAAAVDGLGRLTEFGADHEIGVIVENHGGYSSNGKWLSEVMKQVNHSNCGTLPDFGNFCIERNPDNWSDCLEDYDRYLGTEELMPFAKGVSAKSNVFDETGNETLTDYRKMLAIVKDAGFRGHIGVEYEGTELSEDEGIRATKALLEKVGAELS